MGESTEKILIRLATAGYPAVAFSFLGGGKVNLYLSI